MIFPCWEEGIPWWRFSLPGDFFMEKMQIRPLIVSLLIRCVFPIAAGNHQSLPAADWGVSFRREQHWGESKWGQKSDFFPGLPLPGWKKSGRNQLPQAPHRLSGSGVSPGSAEGSPQTNRRRAPALEKVGALLLFFIWGRKETLAVVLP